MRILAVLAITLAAAAAHAQQAGPDQYRARTATDLARLCTTPASASDSATALAFCHGVLHGAYGYFEASVPAADRFVCLPTNPSPTRTQVANGFVAWLKARPQYANDGAIDALFRYAAEAYPCKR